MPQVTELPVLLAALEVSSKPVDASADTREELPADSAVVEDAVLGHSGFDAELVMLDAMMGDPMLFAALTE